MKRTLTLMVGLALLAATFTGCGASGSAASLPASQEAASVAQSQASSAPQQAQAALPDGVYLADFETDSTMFAVNETCEGKGRLTVQDGSMTIHISLKSQNILNLYLGLAQDAQADGAQLLQPTLDTVTYSDGLTEEVNGFDVPVAAIGQEFDLALIGTKGKWYDHKVSVQNPEPLAETPADGSYTCAVALEGGSGRATVESPATLTVSGGAMTATVVWSSENYDYMKVGEEQYLPVNTQGNAAFEIPVAALDTALPVIADTVAMSTPHEIEYTLTFDSATLQPTAE